MLYSLKSGRTKIERKDCRMYTASTGLNLGAPIGIEGICKKEKAVKSACDIYHTITLTTTPIPINLSSLVVGTIHIY